LRPLLNRCHFLLPLTHPIEPDSYRDGLTPIVGIHGSAMFVVWTLATKPATLSMDCQYRIGSLFAAVHEF
jgi:hypothetical protein